MKYDSEKILELLLQARRNEKKAGDHLIFLEDNYDGPFESWLPEIQMSYKNWQGKATYWRGRGDATNIIVNLGEEEE